VQWEHRLWIVRQNPDPAAAEKELDLCGRFLKYDERNFHCWGYRKQMAALAAKGECASDGLGLSKVRFSVITRTVS
jgi:hypothetical protein